MENEATTEEVHEAMGKAVAAIQHEGFRWMLKDRRMMETLGLAVGIATNDTGQNRIDAVAVIDAILPGNWREIAATPKLNPVEPVDDLHEVVQ